MTQRIIIAIDVPDGVRVAVRQEPAAPAIAQHNAHPAVPTDVCPKHHVEWKGEPGDLWHKDPQDKYCRHPDNLPRQR